MRLDLRFSSRPPEDLWCQAVAVLVTNRPEIDNGILSSLNKKMNGFLKNLLDDNRWTGDRGENLLIATEHTIMSDKLLLHGIGQVSGLNGEVFKEEIIDMGLRLSKMDVREFGVYVPFLDDLLIKYDDCLEISAINLTEAFFQDHKDDPDFILKIIFSIEKELIKIIDPIVKKLREYFNPMLDFSIIVENKGMAQ